MAKIMRVLKQRQDQFIADFCFSIAKIMRVLKLLNYHLQYILCFSIAKIMRVLKLFKYAKSGVRCFSIAKIMRVLKPQIYFSIFEKKLHYNFIFLLIFQPKKLYILPKCNFYFPQESIHKFYCHHRNLTLNHLLTKKHLY